MINIYAISDLHGKIKNIDPSGCDLCLIAGDFAPLSYFGFSGIIQQCDWINKTFIPFLNNYSNVKFVIIPGNHDIIMQKDFVQYTDDIQWPKNIEILIDSEYVFSKDNKSIKIYGTPWVPIINYQWAFEADNEKQRLEYSKIPDDVDILLTHTPPHIDNTFLQDVSLDYNSQPFGSTELAKAIFEKKPKWNICGHIHSGSHEPKKFEETTIVNVSRLNESYEISYEPFIFQI